MRAALIDARLEAVAGPVTLVTEPTRYFEFTGTAIVTGVHVQNGQAQILMYTLGSPNPAINAQVSDSGWPLQRGLAHVSEESGRFTAVAHQSSDQRELRIGWIEAARRHWQGPLLAAVYDRTLSDAEAMRVVRWLTQRLPNV